MNALSILLAYTYGALDRIEEEAIFLIRGRAEEVLELSNYYWHLNEKVYKCLKANKKGKVDMIFK